MEQKTDTSMWRAAWRWHFYASFFVLPLLFILSTSGTQHGVHGSVGSLLYSSRPTAQRIVRDAT